MLRCVDGTWRSTQGFDWRKVAQVPSQAQECSDGTLAFLYVVEALRGPPDAVDAPLEAADLDQPKGRANDSTLSTWYKRLR